MIRVLKSGITTKQSKVFENKTITCNCKGSIPTAQASSTVKAVFGNCK